jgi:Fur family ferric uptake transcriptional regulator
VRLQLHRLIPHDEQGLEDPLTPQHTKIVYMQQGGVWVGQTAIEQGQYTFGRSAWRYHLVVDTSLRRTLHARGMRMTPQRQLVLDAVRELEHATPEAICEHVQRVAPAVNITTVYRTLDLLEGLDLVRHTHLGHGAPRYSTQVHDHVHLVCHRCGDIAEIPAEEFTEFTKQVRQRFGFVIDPTHLALSGRCADCAEQPHAVEITAS